MLRFMKHSAVSAKRVVSLDFLRTTAIMAVVALHTLPVPLLNGGGCRFGCP